MPPASLQVTITQLGSDAPKLSNHAFSVKLPQGAAQHGFSYGTQPPDFRPKNVMTLVSDYDDPHLGPAWFFQVNYDKVVILPQEVLSLPASRARRHAAEAEVDDVIEPTPTPTSSTSTPLDPNAPTSTATPASTGTDAAAAASSPATNNLSGGGSGSGSGSGSGWPPPPGSYPRHNVVTAGSTPWFCYWNGTLLETFVYPNATSEASEKWSSSYGAAGPTTASGYGKRAAAESTDAGVVSAGG
ncbi:hypothetical protein V494_03574, partial [Pseudogymnoascus sp. VKM F-4513 (FW-928)]